MNHDHGNRYAELLVGHAAGLRPGQTVFIATSVDHREAALRVGEVASRLGARRVRYRHVDPLETEQLIRHGTLEQIHLYHVEVEAWFSEIIATGGVLIVLHAVDEPELIPELAQAHPRNYAIYTRGLMAAALAFQTRALVQRLCPVVNAPVPSLVWARRVFPELAENEAMARLAQFIFHVVDADQPDAIERAVARDRELKARAAALNRLGIREIRVTGGGNDLRVSVPDKARWRGGRFRTNAGQQFLPNVPTFEVFTNPDPHRTHGRLVASRPVPLGLGLLVKDLVLEFREGRVIDFQASEGGDPFGRWLATDDGSRSLGEFALVPGDSPIAQSGLLFGYYIFEENAASHVGLGLGLAACLPDSEGMSSQELRAAGCNQSTMHLDIPFGSPNVLILATQSRVGEVVLLAEGKWAVE